MGQSNTIEQQTKLNAEFQRYVDAQTAAMDTTLKQCKSELDELVKKTFTDAKITDSVLLVGGQYQHLQTLSEWSLKHVNDMITAIRNTIFGGPVPTGSKTGDAANLKEAATSLAGMELLIADAAMSAIQGLLSGLTTGTQTDIMKNTVYKQVSDGLYLFLTVVEYKYKRSDFLNNNTIDETIYVYEAYSSAQGLAKVRAMGITAAMCDGYGQVVASDLKNIKRATDAIDALPMDKNFKDNSTYYHDLIDEMQKDMSKNRAELDKLTHALANAARRVLARNRMLLLN